MFPILTPHVLTLVSPLSELGVTSENRSSGPDLCQPAVVLENQGLRAMPSGIFALFSTYASSDGQAGERSHTRAGPCRALQYHLPHTAGLLGRLAGWRLPALRLQAPSWGRMVGS